MSNSSVSSELGGRAGMEGEVLPGALVCSWHTRSGWPCHGRWRRRWGSWGTLAKRACGGPQALAPDARLRWTGMPRCRCPPLLSAGASLPREGLWSAEASPLHRPCISNRNWQDPIPPLLTREARNPVQETQGCDSPVKLISRQHLILATFLYRFATQPCC